VVNLFNAKTDSSAQLYGGRKRANSVGPGIGLNGDEIDWDLVSRSNQLEQNGSNSQKNSNNNANHTTNNTGKASRSMSRENSTDHLTQNQSSSSPSNLARSIGNAAARASSAIIPPSIRGEIIGSSKAKEREREEKRNLHLQEKLELEKNAKRRENHPRFRDGSFDFNSANSSTSSSSQSAGGSGSTVRSTPTPTSEPGMISPSGSFKSSISPTNSRPSSRGASSSSASRLPFGKNKDKMKAPPPSRDHFKLGNHAPSSSSSSTTTSNLNSSLSSSKSEMKGREVSFRQNADGNGDGKKKEEVEPPPGYSYSSTTGNDEQAAKSVQSAPLAERSGFDWNQTSDQTQASSSAGLLTPDGNDEIVSTSPTSSLTALSFSDASNFLANTRSNESGSVGSSGSFGGIGSPIDRGSGSRSPVGVPETVRDAGPGGKSILSHSRGQSTSQEGNSSLDGTRPGVRFDRDAVESASPSSFNNSASIFNSISSLPSSSATSRTHQFPTSNSNSAPLQSPSLSSSATASANNSASNSPLNSPASQSNTQTKVKKSGFKGLIGGNKDKDKDKDSASSASNPSPSSSKSNLASESLLDYKEFKKGTYTYPICIPLPSNLPPTLHSDFGSNAYNLKAFVHRSGPLTPNLVTEREVTLVHAPDEDGMEESDAIVVERNWEDALSYMVVLYGKSFPVGGKIPVWCKFVPLGKCRIHRIVATIEEKVSSRGRRVWGL